MSDPQYKYVSRTQSQPLEWVCTNPECIQTDEERKNHYVRFVSEKPKCPRCTQEGPPVIKLLALVHLLLPDPKGKIQGQYKRWRIACDKDRDYLALTDNNEAATDVPAAANCPGCIKAAPKNVMLVDSLGRQLKAGKDTTPSK